MVADEKDGKTSYSDKLCRDAQLNRKESAKVILLSRKFAESNEHGLAALCHKAERRIHMEACCPKRLTERTWSWQEGPNSSRLRNEGKAGNVLKAADYRKVGYRCKG